ncbi:MAG: 4-alpha-glucanotransferase [marine benthic group bacterium]|nr:4-alpha-glucanotransferase [Gemmatimonadota bacterium]MCL7983906.1 4-alpha-glucanotransferase [Gemmatimonadota bacterium]
MDELTALAALAHRMGVYTEYVDGLFRPVTVQPETLVRVCAALGAEMDGASDAPAALRALDSVERGLLPPVLVAWAGILPQVNLTDRKLTRAEVVLEAGGVVPVAQEGDRLGAIPPLPSGYHALVIEHSGIHERCTVISSPVRSWRRPESHRSWGFAAELAALRSSRSRSVADLRDLETTCRWVGAHGGDLVMVLPLLPTFNREPAEPSPYSPVSRLFWSELILDLEQNHRTSAPPDRLDVTRADAEVRAALSGRTLDGLPGPDRELARYARFRGAQALLGRNWREWPADARSGQPSAADVDPEEERFHLLAQLLARQQLGELRQRLETDGFRLGLDLAVGVHPDGYDTWSRQELFAGAMSVGAPPDGGFPSGQDWGFLPVHPEISRREGHRYLAASIGHQMALAGVLRVDHVMAWTRLYWIPHGMGKHEGTYVSYPAEELFAVLCLESHRNHCEVAGENLGTVPPEIDEALPRHGIWGMFLAQFEAAGEGEISSPAGSEIAMVGTHDTPLLSSWIEGGDIGERIRYGLLAPEEEAEVRAERNRAVERLAAHLDCPVDDHREFLERLLVWLGESDSPLVVPWIEDLWLEKVRVNLPGTPSSIRPNWQRPMRMLLDEVLVDPEVERIVRRLSDSRGPDDERHANLTDQD